MTSSSSERARDALLFPAAADDDEASGNAPPPDPGETAKGATATNAAPATPDVECIDGYAVIAVNRPVFAVYHYRMPVGLADLVVVGTRVEVRFANSRATGVVIEFDDGPPPIAASKVKPITSVIDPDPLFTPETLALAKWMARYYLCPLGEVLASFLPTGVERAQRAVATVSLAPGSADPLAEAEAREKRAPKQAALLRYLHAAEQVPLKTLRGEAVFSQSAFNALKEACLVRVLHGPATGALPEGASTPEVPPFDPTDEQQAAIDAINAQDGFAPCLLHGVTGSGKTEVYLRVIAHAIERGRQAIVLVPEIALTPQTVDRFRARFRRVAVMHSALTSRERSEAWLAIRRGEVDVTIGPRSAIFAPCPALGIIIVDEEHESTFKQQNAPRYHARDLAVKRAHQAGIAVVLGSATPSIESYHNAKEGRYRLLSLPHRVTGRTLPKIQVVDISADGARKGKLHMIGETLERAIEETLKRKEQALLFLNRRGFHTVVICNDCATPIRCVNCDLTMTYHRSAHRLTCHACDHRVPKPEQCPECGSTEGLGFFGLGTERVEDIIARRFPEARIARMDSDTMTKPESYRDVLARFRAGAIDLLIGTQMIAKGLHFPGVTLVGVISADTALSLADFRASERTFQLLTQVAGRAGRGDVAGRVIIQTLDPGHFAITTACRHDYEGFARSELETRRAMNLPPFCRLMRVLLTAKDEARLADVAREAGGRLLQGGGKDVQVLGPVPAPIFRLKAEYRYHALVKAPTPDGLFRAFQAIAGGTPKWRSGVHVIVDVDPMGLS